MLNVIDMHASWLAVSSIVGCYNNCQYCFLQSCGKNNAKPEVLCSPKEAIDQLLNYKYYNENIPVCLLPETDPFLNESNTLYVNSLLDEIIKRNLKNTIVLVTKCYIPEFILEKLKALQNLGTNVVVYLSYSGLEELEPNVNHENIRKNFKNLSLYEIPMIHYFRPLIPQNANRIDEVLDYVSEYTDTSTITGMKLIPNFVDKISFWPELKENRDKALKAESVYPKEAWDYFHGGNYNRNQNIYHTNICALCSKLHQSSFYYGSEECLNLNICSAEQRKLCAEQRKLLSYKQVINNCKKILTNLSYDLTDVNFEFSQNGLNIINLDLEIKDLAYLSYMLNIRVYVTTNRVSEYTYNSMSNGAKPLVLGGK